MCVEVAVAVAVAGRIRERFTASGSPVCRARGIRGPGLPGLTAVVNQGAHGTPEYEAGDPPRLPAVFH